VGIEMHSFSKTFHMTGWRLAFAVGNKELVGGLLRIKSNLDSGVFGAVQHAGIIAMRNFERIVPGLVSVYESRARVLANGLRGIGWGGFTVPEGTFYVWLPNRGGRNSMQMTIDVLENCKIMVTPGTAFGEAGEGYFRIALTAGEERIRQAVERFRKAGI
jgi:LL-diaminopimelate aminotransferase